MAIGIVSDSEFELELAKLGIIVEKTVINEKVVDIKRGRGERSEVPMAIREVIADESLSGVPAVVIQEAYGISQSSISAYKEGATSTATIHRPNQHLKEHVDETKDFIGNTARSKILTAFDLLDKETISKAKPRDIAGIAKDMSVIAKNMEPAAGVRVSQQNINIYRPRMKEEDDYQIVEVSE